MVHVDYGLTVKAEVKRPDKQGLNPCKQTHTPLIYPYASPASPYFFNLILVLLVSD